MTKNKARELKMVWSDVETQTLKTCIVAEMDLVNIQSALPRFSAIQINRRIRYLTDTDAMPVGTKYPRRSFAHWKTTEVVLLKRYFPFYSKAYMVELLTRFEWSQISSKAKLLKLKKIHRNRKDLTPRQEEYIRLNHQRESAKLLVESMVLPMDVPVLKQWIKVFCK